MRAARLMSLLLHLQTRGQLTARELAGRLEVSERTIQRDIEALAEAGVPVRTVRGPAGGYRLEGGYRTRLTGLTAQEAEALSFLGLAGPAGQLGLGATLDTARDKVLAALTGEGQARARRAGERFHFDPVRWYGTAEPTPLLAAVARALWEDRRVRIRYASAAAVADGGGGAATPAGSVATRTVDPLGLVLASGDWYLMGRRRGAVRTYRVSRLLDVEILAERADRPAGFDLAASWAASRRELETRHSNIEVTVRVDAEALPRLRRLVAVTGQARIDVTALPGNPVELTVPFEGEAWAVSALLGLGGAVEVLAPAGLRDRISGEVERMAARYRGVRCPAGDRRWTPGYRPR